MRRQTEAGGMPGHQELEEAGGTLPWSLGRECGPADTPPVDFWPQSWENKCLFACGFQSVVTGRDSTGH